MKEIKKNNDEFKEEVKDLKKELKIERNYGKSKKKN